MTSTPEITWTITPLLGNKKWASDIYEELALNFPSLPASNHWSYIRPLLENFYQGSVVFIAAARKNEKLFVLFPLVLSNQIKYGYRWIEFGLPYHKHMNLISIPDITEDELPYFFSVLETAIHKLPLKWHRLSIRNILLDSAARKVIAKNYTAIEYTDNSSWFDTSINKIPESIISKKLVKNLNRLQKKILAIDSKCELLEISSTEDIGKTLIEFRSIEENSWKGKSGISINSSNKLISFYSEMLNSFSSYNQARIFHYGSEDKIFASALGFHLGDSLYIHKISFDNNYTDAAPGSLLMLEIIKKSLINKHIKRVSLVTYPDWAKRWHPENTPMLNLISYNHSIRGQAVKIIITTWRKLKPIFKKIISIV